MPRILLVAPSRPLPVADHVRPLLKALVAPGDLATVAALTPAGFEVDIWDEAVRGKITRPADVKRRYDLIGVGGYSADFERAIAVGKILEGLGVPVVVGGVGVSAEPQKYRDVFDVLFIGEAEYTWPRFLADFQAGDYRDEYSQVSRVAMTDSPAPDWSSIASDIGAYGQTVVQTTRGCPFDCEFCDVISLFGRAPRHKTIEQVLEEVRVLQKLGASAIMLADDNLYGDKKYTKPLLRELARLNASFDRPVKFWTQITLNVSHDDEMLELLSAANVESVLIGIESPNLESLKETNKPQNYKLDIRAALRKIQSYGLCIEASLIVGFDHDDESIFQQQFEFIQEACLVPVFIWTLTAMPGTRLWVRLHAEGRVFAKSRAESMATVQVHQHNVVPKRMTLPQLLSGYRDLLLRVHSWDAFEARLSGLVGRIETVPPLMLRMPGMSRWQIAKFFFANLINSKGRRSLLKLIGDRDANGIKKRLMARFPGDSDRERYVRRVIENAVDDEFGRIHSELPVLIREIDAELERLATHGLPERQGAVFAIPDAFRRSFASVFPQLHDYVSRHLHDKTRVEKALVDIVYDFVTRWGATFDEPAAHHGVQLLETCDRTIAMENDDPDRAVGLEQVPFEFTADAERIADPALRKLAADVIRCVEAEFWRLGHADAPLTATGTQ